MAEKLSIKIIQSSQGFANLVFSGRPTDAMLEEMKAEGWRYSRNNNCWYPSKNAQGRDQMFAYRFVAKYDPQEAQRISNEQTEQYAQEIRNSVATDHRSDEHTQTDNTMSAEEFNLAVESEVNKIEEENVTNNLSPNQKKVYELFTENNIKVDKDRLFDILKQIDAAYQDNNLQVDEYQDYGKFTDIDKEEIVERYINWHQTSVLSYGKYIQEAELGSDVVDLCYYDNDGKKGYFLMVNGKNITISENNPNERIFNTEQDVRLYLYNTFEQYFLAIQNNNLEVEYIETEPSEVVDHHSDEPSPTQAYDTVTARYNDRYKDFYNDFAKITESYLENESRYVGDARIREQYNQAFEEMVKLSKEELIDILSEAKTQVEAITSSTRFINAVSPEISRRMLCTSYFYDETNELKSVAHMENGKYISPSSERLLNYLNDEYNSVKNEGMSITEASRTKFEFCIIPLAGEYDYVEPIHFATAEEAIDEMINRNSSGTYEYTYGISMYYTDGKYSNGDYLPIYDAKEGEILTDIFEVDSHFRTEKAKIQAQKFIDILNNKFDAKYELNFDEINRKIERSKIVSKVPNLLNNKPFNSWIVVERLNSIPPSNANFLFWEENGNLKSQFLNDNQYEQVKDWCNEVIEKDLLKPTAKKMYLERQQFKAILEAPTEVLEKAVENDKVTEYAEKLIEEKENVQNSEEFDNPIDTPNEESKTTVLDQTDLDNANKIIPEEQYKFVLEAMQGEEREYFASILKNASNTISAAQKKRGKNINKDGSHPCLFHYFLGSSHWFISEIDKDGIGYGYAILNNDLMFSEWGSVNVCGDGEDALTRLKIDAPILINGSSFSYPVGVEMDFHLEEGTTIERELYKLDNEFFSEYKEYAEEPKQEKTIDEIKAEIIKDCTEYDGINSVELLKELKERDVLEAVHIETVVTDSIKTGNPNTVKNLFNSISEANIQLIPLLMAKDNNGNNALHYAAQTELQNPIISNEEYQASMYESVCNEVKEFALKKTGSIKSAENFILSKDKLNIPNNEGLNPFAISFIKNNELREKELAKVSEVSINNIEESEKNLEEDNYGSEITNGLERQAGNTLRSNSDREVESGRDNRESDTRIGQRIQQREGESDVSLDNSRTVPGINEERLEPQSDSISVEGRFSDNSENTYSQVSSGIGSSDMSERRLDSRPLSHPSSSEQFGNELDIEKLQENAKKIDNLWNEYKRSIIDSFTINQKQRFNELFKDYPSSGLESLEREVKKFLEDNVRGGTHYPIRGNLKSQVNSYKSDITKDGTTFFDLVIKNDDGTEIKDTKYMVHLTQSLIIERNRGDYIDLGIPSTYIDQRKNFTESLLKSNNETMQKWGKIIEFDNEKSSHEFQFDFIQDITELIEADNEIVIRNIKEFDLGTLDSNNSLYPLNHLHYGDIGGENSLATQVENLRNERKMKELNQKYGNEPYVFNVSSESPLLRNDDYSLKEFNELVQQENLRIQKDRKFLCEKYHVDSYYDLPSAYDEDSSIEEEDRELLKNCTGYDKTDYMIVWDSGESRYTPVRMDIGDGDGNVFDFVRSTCSYNEIIDALNTVEDSLYHTAIEENFSNKVKEIFAEHKDALSTQLSEKANALHDIRNELKGKWLINVSEEADNKNRKEKLLSEIETTIKDNLKQIYNEIYAWEEPSNNNESNKAFVIKESRKYLTDIFNQPSRDSQRAMNEGKSTNFDWETWREWRYRMPVVSLLDSDFIEPLHDEVTSNMQILTTRTTNIVEQEPTVSMDHHSDEPTEAVDVKILTKEDYNLFKEWGEFSGITWKDDLIQLQATILSSKFSIEENGKEKNISAEKAIEVLGRREFLSGIERSAFHYSASRPPVYFNTYDRDKLSATFDRAEKLITPLITEIENELNNPEVKQETIPQNLKKSDIKEIRKQCEEILKKSDSEITEADKEILAQYEGAGGLHEGGQTASAVLSEFYTPSNVINSVWQIVDHYAPNAKTVLEPTAGTGRFAVNRPNNEFTLHELDETSARIAKILHPEADVRQGAYQKQFFDNGGRIHIGKQKEHYDVVIGNPPYGTYRSEWKGRGEGQEFDTYQEYFLSKGLDALKDKNSILAMVVPSGILKSQNDKVKKILADKGQLIDAYRLPEGTFPTTEVGTDILIFRNWENKKEIVKTQYENMPNASSNIDDILEARKLSMAEELSDNFYFTNHPEKILGEVKTRTNRFGKSEEYVAVHEGLSVQDELNKISSILGVNNVEIENTNEIAQEIPEPSTSINDVTVSSVGSDATEPTEEQTEELDDASKRVYEDTEGLFTTKKQLSTKEFAKFYTGANFTEEDYNIWAATDWKGEVDITKLSSQEIEYLKSSDNYVETSKDVWTNAMLYATGNIYEKLDLLELKKNTLTEENYLRAKNILENAIPPIVTMENIMMDALSPLADEFKVKREVTTSSWNIGNRNIETNEVEVSLRNDFINWATNCASIDNFDENNDPINSRMNITNYTMAKISREDIPEDIAWQDIVKYCDRIPVNSNVNKDDSKETKLKKETIAGNIKDKRKATAYTLFNRYLQALPQEDKERLQETWNKIYNAQVQADYKKLPLFIEGMSTFKGNSPFILFKQQVEGINRLLSKGNGLLAYEVGVGKTACGIVATVGQLQSGRCKKPLIVVPNQVYKKWVADFQQLFPDIEVNDLYNLSDKYIEHCFDEKTHSLVIKPNTVTFITHSALMNITFSDQVCKNELAEDFGYLLGVTDELNSDDDKIRASAEEKIMLQIGRASRVKENKLPDGRVEEIQQKYIFFDECGFDNICVDEAHNFKNLFTVPRTKNKGNKKISNEFDGIGSGKPSIRAYKMFGMTTLIQRYNEDRNVFLLTATPFTNNPLEVYSMLSYMGRKELINRHIYDVRDFCTEFALTKYEYSVTPAGDVKTKPVMKNFRGQKKLKNLVHSYIDQVSGKEAGIARPEREKHPVFLQLTPLQEAIIKIEQNTITSEGPNEVLAAMTTMRTATLSPALLDPNKFAGSEILDKLGGIPPKSQLVESSPKLTWVCNTCADLYKQKPECGQFIYMPQGTEYFDEVKNYLIKQGIPEDAIEYVHGQHNSEAEKKEKIAHRFNDKEDRLKILIGSKTLAEGIDLNGNSIVCYNTMLDWNPTEAIQVEGRIWRQGNEQGKVHIMYPLMENSIDSLMYQKHDEKTQRINSVLSKTDDGQDVIETNEINPEELKFELITDPVKKINMIIEQKTVEKRKELKIIENRIEEISELEGERISTNAIYNEQVAEKEKQKLLLKQAREILKLDPENWRKQTDVTTKERAVDTCNKEISKCKNRLNTIMYNLSKFDIQNPETEVAIKSQELVVRKAEIEADIQKIVDSKDELIVEEEKKRLEKLILAKPVEEQRKEMVQLVIRDTWYKKQKDDRDLKPKKPIEAVKDFVLPQEAINKLDKAIVEKDYHILHQYLNWGTQDITGAASDKAVELLRKHYEEKTNTKLPEKFTETCDYLATICDPKTLNEEYKFKSKEDVLNYISRNWNGTAYAINGDQNNINYVARDNYLKNRNVKELAEDFKKHYGSSFQGVGYAGGTFGYQCNGTKGVTIDAFVDGSRLNFTASYTEFAKAKAQQWDKEYPMEKAKPVQMEIPTPTDYVKDEDVLQFDLFDFEQDFKQPVKELNIVNEPRTVYHLLSNEALVRYKGLPPFVKGKNDNWIVRCKGEDFEENKNYYEKESVDIVMNKNQLQRAILSYMRLEQNRISKIQYDNPDYKENIKVPTVELSETQKELIKDNEISEAELKKQFEELLYDDNLSKPILVTQPVTPVVQQNKEIVESDYIIDDEIPNDAKKIDNANTVDPTDIF